MYLLPDCEGGETGPTKSIPSWNHGDLTGTGCSSGLSQTVYILAGTLGNGLSILGVQYAMELNSCL